MNSTARLRARGDGKLRTEELVAEAIRAVASSPETLADFARHPILSALSPVTLLGKVSRKRATRLIESGILSAEFELVPDTIFPRGRELDVSLPLVILLSELDLLPPSAAVGAPPLPIVFENDDFLAIDKPAGLPSAPLRSDDPDSAVQRVLAIRPAMPILRGNPLEPGLVHRLDTGTSGVLLFAKTEGAFAHIDRAWNSGAVRKIYRALTRDGKGGLPMGRITLKLGHDLKSKKRMRAVVSDADRKKIRGEPLPTVSEVLTVKRVVRAPDDALAGGLSDVEIRIETGVHHQVRATLAHFSTPILGDSTYGGAPEERVWLHAWKLVLPTGDSGKSLEIVAPLPPGWFGN
ncbi:MAG: RluA family pseudouridine synthase [Bdellovibrionales bacterium]|nr:RluA family pseudouridine synthase [Bdellovibrionales bacterium]